MISTEEKVLLVEPDFPIPRKSKNHAKFLPISLLKHAKLHEERGDRVELVRGNRPAGFEPDLVKITSLFTYWSTYVHDSIKYYQHLYPRARIQVGGIYASLMPEHIRNNFPNVEVFEGVDEELDRVGADYRWIDVDYQILQASRGCFRRCSFCGVWKIERKITFKTWPELEHEIVKNKVVFYDSQMLANPNIHEIFEGIFKLRVNGRVVRCEAQSGFDPRLITSELAKLIKKARFSAVRISWDWGLEQGPVVRRALERLNDVGYHYKNTSVFMLYNWRIPFEILERKREICWKWNVQITDCRYRPLDQLYDNYSPRRCQTSADYYIHPKWTDERIKTFRRRVREQNICIRFGFQDIQHYKNWIRYRKRTKPLINDGLFSRTRSVPALSHQGELL